MFVEGWWVVHASTFVGRVDLLSDLWKEYALSDSRYVVGDPSVWSIEAVTAVCCYQLIGIVFMGSKQFANRLANI
jgi:hypothetical protein